MKKVQIKGTDQKFGFPDDMSDEEIKRILLERMANEPIQPRTFEQNMQDELTPRKSQMRPYEPSFAEKTAQTIGNFLYDKGIISDRYGANEIGSNLASILEFAPVAGDASAGDEFGRAVAQGDTTGVLLAGAGAIPIVGDAAKIGLKSAVERFSDKALRYAEDQASTFNPKESIVTLTPKEFIDMAEKLDEGVSPEKMRGLEGVSKFDDVPFLTAKQNDDGSLKVVGHEGRHRAYKLLEEGYDSMPVRIRLENGYWGKIKQPERIYGESSGELDLNEVLSRSGNKPTPQQQLAGDNQLANDIQSIQQTNAPQVQTEGIQNEYYAKPVEQVKAASEARTQAIRQRRGISGSDWVLQQSSRPNQSLSRQKDGSLNGLLQAPNYKAAANPKIQSVAESYMKRMGQNYKPPNVYAKIKPERSTEIANLFDQMEHNPQDPEVKAAYQAMIDETLEQYEEILKTGFKPEFIDFENMGDPYSASPREAIKDINENNHMWVFSTRDGFGSDDAFDPSDNPLLQETDYMISGKPALANDIFRIVHDYFGHAKEGVGFRASGEENAWRSHAAMYSPLARRALTTETRGQNSWVNYGKYGEKNRTASADETVFADQKIGLLPEWVSEGFTDDDAYLGSTGKTKSGKKYNIE